MAENPNVDLAQTIMIDRFGLEEQTYVLESFSENAKGDITIRMSDGFVPVTAKLPQVLIEVEKIRKMSVDEKRERFNWYLPNWNKLPIDVRELFSDIADNVDDPDELPTLKEVSGPRITVELNGKELTPTVKRNPKPKRPVAKKKGA